MKKGRTALAFSERFPKPAQIAAVLAVIVLFVYSWTLYRFFFSIPGWLYYLTGGEVLVTLAYSLATNLAESLLVLLLPLLAAVALPRRWFGDMFVARGIALVLPGLVYLIYLARQMQSIEDYPSQALNWYPFVLAITLALVLLAGRLIWLRVAIENIAERATILLYIYIPLSIVSIVGIIIRIVIQELR